MPAESAFASLRSSFRIFIAFLVLLGTVRARAAAPRSDDAKLRNRAIELCQQSNFAAALPLLEKLAKAHPFDVSILERLGGALMGTAATTGDPVAKKRIVSRARRLFLHLKELGDKSEYVTTMLERLPESGEASSFAPR